MAQRSIEILIGRLLTDEAFRDAFGSDPTRTLQRFRDSGHELTELELAALSTTSMQRWQEVADQVDPRLQKANLARRKEESNRE